MTDRTHPELESLRRQLAEAERAQATLKREFELRIKELERSQSHLQSLVNYAPNFIHIVDANLRVNFINRGGSELRPEDIIGSKVGEYMAPAERRRVRRRLRQVLKTGKPTQYEFKAVGENNTQAWYRTNAGPIDQDGQVVGLVLMTFDISGDHYRAQTLREDKQAAESARIRDRALLNSIGEGLIVIDEHGLIATINPSGSAMLGYRPEEILGQWFPRVVPVLDEQGQAIDTIDRPIMRALSSGQVISEQVRYYRQDGSSFPAAITVSPVVVAGKPIGAIEVFRDLTRERELERAKEEFVSLASHQLRTPATGVKAYISMLLDGYAGSVSPRQQEFLQKVFHANERQLQIVNDMLNVARVDAGRIIPEMVSTNVKTLIRDIVDEQRLTIRERQQKLEVMLPARSVEAVLDPKLIRMAVENILNNASKYTPEGGSVGITLSLVGDLVCLAISDTGVGIAAEDIPRLFKRFSRIDNPLSTSRGGSGLGLYLTQTIVALHSGRLSVDSALDTGTTFRIELPLYSKAGRISSKPEATR
ncbi:MAG TPA: PAS domain-containing protein [Candidatus Saccharimonadales bacterium]|nr:PAS domain-containing protein [Candidatus Saccharimonadales bacterium]